MSDIVKSLEDLRERVLDHEEDLLKEFVRHDTNGRIQKYKSCILLAECENEIFGIMSIEKSRLSDD